MARYTEWPGKPEIHTDPDANNNGVNLTAPVIGILAYIILVVPIISLLLVGALDLSRDYVMPIAIALGVTGFYVTEKRLFR